MRRAQALRPRWVGVWGGAVVGVWANWDRFELRDEAGSVLLAWESTEDKAWVMRDFHLAGGRWLVVGVGTGIMSRGYRVYDREAGAWVVDASIRSSDVGVVAVADDRPALLLGDGEEMVCHTVDGGGERWSANVPDTFAAAFCPRSGRVVIAGTEVLVVLDGYGREQARAAWSGPEPSSLAWLGEARVLSTAFGGGLRVLDAGTLETVATARLDIREVRSVAVSPDGTRMACMGNDGAAWIADTDAMIWDHIPDVAAAAFVGERLVGLGSSGLRTLE